MANAKTTSPATAPAPWVNRYDDSPPHVTDARGTALCHVYPMGRGEIGRANARLIAAAPDLYEACKAALEEGDDYVALQKIKAAVAKAEGADEPERLCEKCGVQPATYRDLCDACEKARVAEIRSVSDYYRSHPDACCCHTYLGRASCLSPVHGDWWRVNGIEHGERFFLEIRARDRAEAVEVGTEACQEYGGECVSVRKMRPPKAA